ncbi:ABC transporter substrate-binding protein [Pueribacillus theae]|uniref:ABC transporter substrate-binding protein n=1 Tax=Pueribacillus theae TaxID=2171751 RepID=A0A2U1K4A7_9BACI|nr:ABC transporter substrate-binding protein [Pueribacillus theae]PWA11813.1 ABC transporter substrate-binding protein [Pueribacillus theae]
MQGTQLKFIIRFLLLIAFVFVIVGCSSKTSGQPKDNGTKGNEASKTEEGKPQKGGEATFAYQTDVSNYDPILGSAGSDHALLWPVYATLIEFSPELEPEAGLAESWDFADDKTLQLTLREGVTFHDGTPFNAEAVKFNIERANSENSKVTDLKNIESVEVVDEKTVKLHLSQPDSSILLALSDRGGMMVSPTAVEEKGDDFSQNPVGAGPYKMEKRVPNGEIVFKAFEDYWQEGQPYLDKMTVKIMADENTRINALKSGEIDLADDIKPGNVQSLKNEANIILKDKTSVAFRMLYLNAEKEPINNKAVRQAILYGINRDAIIQAINFGSGESAYIPFPKEYWAADQNIKIDYDPEKAKQILKDAGVENVKIKMNHYSTAYEQRLAEAIKSQLAEVGIQVELQAMELQAAVSNYFVEKEVPMFLSSWTGRPDPQITIKNLFARDSFYNAGGHSTDEIESLISEAAGTYEQEGRAKLYSEISQKALLEEAIMIPIFFEPRAAAMNQSIKGYEPNLLGKPIFSTIWKEQ